MEGFCKKYSKVITAVLLILALLIIVPVVVGSGYTYLCEDDFSFEGGANDMAEIWHSEFVGGFVRAYEYYMTVQGTYIFNSVIHILRAYTRWQMPGFHMYMIFINVVFAFSVYFMVRGFFKDKVAAAAIMLVSSYAIYEAVGTINDVEIFHWYTGTLNFTLGLTFTFLALGFCLRYIRRTDRESGTKYLVPSMIFAFLGSGVALEVTSPNCAFLLAVIIIAFPKFANDKKIVLPFVAAFAGALFNVLAPGNYPKTYDNMKEGHVTVWDAFRDTFTCYGTESKIILGSPVFWAVLVFAFLVCVGLKVRIIDRKMTVGLLVFTIVGSFLVQYFTMFPVCFGYHSQSLNVMRTTATYELVGRLMYIFAVLCLAQWCIDNGIKNALVVATALFVLISVGCVFTGRLKTDLKEGFSYKCAKDFMNGSMQEAYKTRAYVLNALDLAPEGSDVYLEVPLRANPESSYGMGLLDNSEEFVNKSAAGLFHLNSVAVIYTD